MMQGDGYALSLEIYKANGDPVEPEELEEAQITLGHLTKTFSSGELRYDDETMLWIFPVTQQESFQLPVGCVRVQLRLRWIGGTVEGLDLGHIHVEESVNKEVL